MADARSTLVASRRCLERCYGRRAVSFLDWMSVVVLLGCVYVGHLQSRGLDRGWITSYGGDILAPVFLQWTLRRVVAPCAKWGAEASAALVWLACIAWELAQRFELQGTIVAFADGTFDPVDLWVYTGALAAGYGLDRALRRRHPSAGG